MPRLLIAGVLVFAQSGAATFAGTWTADLGGKAFVRLEIQETNGRVAGRISLADIHVNTEGVVDTVLTDARGFTPIFDIQLQDGMLSFARKDGDDIDRFELREVGGATELAFVPSAADRETLAREGVPLPKPIRLTKAPR